MTGAKNVNTLLNAFKSTQMNLLGLKKYEGLVSDDDHGHTVHAVNQIKGLNKTNPDRSLMQTESYEERYAPSTNNHSRQLPTQHQQTQMYGNPYQQFQPHFTPCYKCGV